MKIDYICSIYIEMNESVISIIKYFKLYKPLKKSFKQYYTHKLHTFDNKLL